MSRPRGAFPKPIEREGTGQAVGRFAAHCQSSPTRGLALVFDAGEFLVIGKARPIWRGSRHSGNVDLPSDSGMPANTRYSTITPFEAEKRTDRNARLV